MGAGLLISCILHIQIFNLRMNVLIFIKLPATTVTSSSLYFYWISFQNCSLTYSLIFDWICIFITLFCFQIYSWFLKFFSSDPSWSLFIFLSVLTPPWVINSRHFILNFRMSILFPFWNLYLSQRSLFLNWFFSIFPLFS